MITINNYQNKTKEFVIYPKQLGIIYTGIGLVDETIELFEEYKHYESFFKTKEVASLENAVTKLKNEVGDCLFYLANLCTELNIEFSSINDPERSSCIEHGLYEELIIVSGKVLGKIKKLIRDEDMNLTDEKKNEIIEYLKDYYLIISVICEDGLSCPIYEVLQMNVNKLQSRKDRGVIKGSGSDR